MKSAEFYNTKSIFKNLFSNMLPALLLMQSSCILGLITEPDEKARQSMAALAYNSPCSRLASCKKNPSNQKRYKLSENKYLERLEDTNPAVRTRAVTEVAEFNYSSDEIIAKLERMASNDESKWVRRAAVKSLSKISGNRSKNIISSACSDEDEWVRHSAKKAMLKLK
jgi:HEAT repeat protein